MKMLVNPGKTLSIKGRPRAGGVEGLLVDVDDSQVKRLLQEGVISDPRKPLLASPAIEAVQRYKKSPQVKPTEGQEAQPSAAPPANVQVPGFRASTDAQPPVGGGDGDGGGGDDDGGEGGVDDQSGGVDPDKALDALLNG